MSVILRDLSKDTIRLNLKLKISNFVPYCLEKIIRERVPDHNYILGVTYETGDSQICMSGHRKEGESIEEGCCREMSEELFLEPKYPQKPIFSTKVNHFFCYDLRDLRPRSIQVVEKYEDTRDRAVICVHGTEKDILRYMKRIKKQEYINDRIVGIWSARKKNVLGAIYGVRENSKGINFLY
jgi:hypothetical protein